MPSDNVTPFRKRRPQPQQRQSDGGLGFKTHRGKAVLAHLLTLAAFGLNFAYPAPPMAYIGMAVGIAGAALAYTNRAAAMPWAQTHHEHALRTLLIGYSLWVIAGLLQYIHGSLAVVTVFVQFAILIWAVIRAGIALVLAIMRKPIPHPRGWLI